MTVQSKFAWAFEYQEQDGSDKIAIAADGLSRYFYADDTPQITYRRRVWGPSLTPALNMNRWVTGILNAGSAAYESTYVVNNYVDTESTAFTAAGLNNPPGFTVEILLMCPADIGDTVQWYQKTATGTAATTHYFIVNKYQSLKSQFFITDNGGTQRSIQEATGMSYATWNHYVCTVQKGTGNPFYIYRNGTATAGGATSWTYGDIKPFTDWSSIFWGSRNAAGWNYQAYCRLYKDYLDATEVADLYNSGNYRNIDYINPNWRNNSQCKLDNGSIQVRV